MRVSTLRADHLPLAPRPVLRATASARIFFIGRAPGTKVNTTGIPWNDPSGDRLRVWLELDRDTFYDEECIAIMPIGFCYPGRNKKAVTDTVQAWQDYGAPIVPTLRRSWRVNGWLKRNPWFEAELVPELRQAVDQLL